MSLRKWLANGWLIAHSSSPQEIADLIGVIDREMVQLAHDLKKETIAWIQANAGHLILHDGE